MQWLSNFIAFQIGWFACVLGGAHLRPWLGTLLVAVLIIGHLWQLPRPRSELMLIIGAGLLGLVADSVLMNLGLTRFPSGILIEGIAPHWMIAMWMLFATTLNISMRWLKQRWLLMILFGALGGPLAYYAGFKLGGVMFHDTFWLSMAALALVWAAAMPVLMALSERWDGTQHMRPQHSL